MKRTRSTWYSNQKNVTLEQLSRAGWRCSENLLGRPDTHLVHVSEVQYISLGTS